MNAQLMAMPYYPCDTTEIEMLKARVRAWFEDRAFAIRIRDRTQLLLRLMNNELADEKTYAARIRASLNQLGIVRRHAIYRSVRLHGKFTPPLPSRRSSRAPAARQCRRTSGLLLFPGTP